MTHGERWLADRLQAAPPSLRETLEAALADVPADRALEDALFETGEQVLQRAIAGPPDRRTAMTLLAADAIVTLACEYAARRRAERTRAE